MTSSRPIPPDPTPSSSPAAPIDGTSRRRVAVVTGSRAEFGLLLPVIRAIREHPALDAMVIASGSHLISPGETFYEVKRHVPVADTVPMQIAGRVGRHEDADAVGRGVARFTRSFAGLSPDWVVVLGDRIEAFAAATTASIGGWALAHIHGGDRAEGVADEAMRHAISKLAHLHFPATAQSAERLIRMGEPAERVHAVGSPAIDGLEAISSLGDDEFQALGSPLAVLLLHPIGRHDEAEEWSASSAIEGLRQTGLLEHTLALHPNFDPGRRGILRAIESAIPADRVRTHLRREIFVGLLKRLASASHSPNQRPGVLIGNSSAGLIEAAALGVPVVDIGDRQAGRERAGNALHAPDSDPAAIAGAIDRARSIDCRAIEHPYGDGRAGIRIAEHLGAIDPHSSGFLRKRNAY